VRADVWALGISLCELAMLRHPYAGVKDAFAIAKLVEAGPVPTLPAGLYSEDFNDFVKQWCVGLCLERPAKWERVT
jgi:serine/threonine protein kinase